MSSEQLMNVIGFAITVAMGVVSITLGAFAIWLSKHFDTRSSAALESIKELASEIRTLSSASLSQQEHFSTKMLDSILTAGPYGAASAEHAAPKATEELVRRQMAETEARIIHSVEAQVTQLSDRTNQTPSEVQKTLLSIRELIGQLTEKATIAAASPSELPSDVRAKLNDYRRLPAYFPLIASILREGTTSEAQMKGHAAKYAFRPGWETGLTNLLKTDLLQGSRTEFSVRDTYLRPLATWVDANWQTIERLVESYRKHTPEDTAAQKEQLVLAESLVI